MGGRGRGCITQGVIRLTGLTIEAKTATFALRMAKCPLTKGSLI